MDNREAVNWLINILSDIGNVEHSDLWHYEQALTEIKDMLESAQPEERKESLCKKVRALCEESKIEFFFVGGGESTWSVTNNKHIKKIVECHKAQLSQEDTTKYATSDTISRQEAIEALVNKGQASTRYKLSESWELNSQEIKEALNAVPPAQRNGTWITDINNNDNAYCSECGLLTTKDLLKRIALVGENKPKFCPNCGAKMVEK